MVKKKKGTPYVVFGWRKKKGFTLRKFPTRQKAEEFKKESKWSKKRVNIRLATKKSKGPVLRSFLGK